MTRKDFVESLNSIVPKPEVAQRMNFIYQCEVPIEIIKILSFYDSPEFFDENESRTLYLEEVAEAEEKNDVPFKSEKLVPVVDLGNNDFIVYNANKKTWGIYNILDMIIFKETDSFIDLFLNS